MYVYKHYTSELVPSLSCIVMKRLDHGVFPPTELECTCPKWWKLYQGILSRRDGKL